MSLRRIRRVFLLFLVGALTVLPACGDSDGDDEGAEPAAPNSTALDDRLAELSGAGVFVGGVAFTGNLVSIHFDQPDDRNAGMKIFVTDGLPAGNAEWFEGPAPGGTFKLTSTSGKATIDGKIEDFQSDGTVTLADGVVRNFFTRPGRRRGGHLRGHHRRRRGVEGHVAQRVDPDRPPDGELRGRRGRVVGR